MNLAGEKELLLKIKQDPRQFGVVFDLYYKLIFNYIFRRVADYDTSRDIAAETFLKAFLHIGDFKWKNISIGPWLYRIATNETNYYFRNKRISTKYMEEVATNVALTKFDNEQYLSEKQLLEHELKMHEDYVKVQHCLAQLDVKYQEVISLRYFEKKSILEIAEILSKKEGTIKSLLSRGTEKIRILMKDAT